MEDRKLLEAAAKAAGFHYHGVRVGLDYENCYVSKTGDTDDWFVWSPLTDDGQALQLMAILGLDVQYSPEAVEVVAHQHARIDGKEAVAPWAWESLLGTQSPAAPTRRAIVSAAAAVANAQAA